MQYDERDEYASFEFDISAAIVVGLATLGAVGLGLTGLAWLVQTLWSLL